MNYFIGALKKYADFSGRARRKEYWMYILIYFVLCIIVSALDAFLGMGFLSLIFSIALLIPSLSIATRRLHDTGRSGWWQLIALLPLIGFIVLLVFLLQDSREENDYGVNPKAAIQI